MAGYPNILHRGLGLAHGRTPQMGQHVIQPLLNYARTQNKKWYDLDLQLDLCFMGIVLTIKVG